MRKADAMKRWRESPADVAILEHFEPIQPKTRGSRYGCCGIRIDGSPAFVDAVLSRLRELLDGENHVTRLELSRNPVKAQPGFKAGQNAGDGAECCYIRLHVRGAEGSHVSAAFDRHLDGATERYAGAIGVTDA